MNDDAKQLEAAYLDALLALTDVLGLDDEIGTMRPPSINLNRVPATALAAGRAAVRFLAVGAGLLDPTCPRDSAGVSAEEALATWTRGEAK